MEEVDAGSADNDDTADSDGFYGTFGATDDDVDITVVNDVSDNDNVQFTADEPDISIAEESEEINESTAKDAGLSETSEQAKKPLVGILKTTKHRQSKTEEVEMNIFSISQDRKDDKCGDCD